MLVSKDRVELVSECVFRSYLKLFLETLDDVRLSIFQKEMIKPTGLMSPSGGDGNCKSCQSALEATELEKRVELQMIRVLFAHGSHGSLPASCCSHYAN